MTAPIANQASLFSFQGIFSGSMSAAHSLVAAGPVTGPVTASGTGGADILEGSNLADDLSGDAGDDILKGYDGDDTLSGGAGNDILEGGAGNDTLQDREGNNQLRGGAGNDFLQGSLGLALDDSTGLLDGGDGNDYLLGYNGYNFAGGAGDDVFSISVSSLKPVDTVVDGGDGADTFEFSFTAQAQGRLAITGGAGADTFIISGQGPVLAQSQLRITDFAAGAGGDTIDLSWFLPYNYANNPFTSGLLRLTAEGDDTLVQVRTVTGYVSVLQLAGIAPLQLTSSNFAGGTDPRGTNTGLALSGTALDDILIGGQMDDSLAGRDGADVLNGMGGADRLDGGAGNDSLEGGEGSDVLLGGDGDDLLFDSSSEGNNELYGGAGNDFLESRSAGSNLLDGGKGDDRLFGHNTGEYPSTGQYTLHGGEGNDFLSAYRGAILEGGDGDDTLVSQNGGARLDGGNGVDQVRFAQASADYTVTRTETGFEVANKAAPGNAPDLLTGIERLQFADINIALDLDGAAGQTFRIYRTAFDRAPDAAGMGFWLSQMNGKASLVDIAGGFAASSEFAQLYGNAPSNTELVTRMYTNILHRDPEPGGYAFWLDVLESGKADLATVLVSISESVENRSAVAELIANGIPFTPYGG